MVLTKHQIAFRRKSWDQNWAEDHFFEAKLDKDFKIKLIGCLLNSKMFFIGPTKSIQAATLVSRSAFYYDNRSVN